NNNYDKSISMNTNTLAWNLDNELNYKEKTLSIDEDKKTSILELNKNSKLSIKPSLKSVEIFVLDGTYTNEFGDFKKGTYLNLPEERQDKVSCQTSCKIFRKENYRAHYEKVIIDTTKSDWLEGHGNLKVIPLVDNTALVYWPKNEVFIEHKHWGGEEIFVLQGTFIDEYSEFEKDTWIRNHHLSVHHPFVKEETVIFVKTGHI
ncbi:cupin domain-containing protein, partial [Arcobacteraceae bacterium]|nr:cupin domain-containing protein [Arcobacteraceae bacterium]